MTDNISKAISSLVDALPGISKDKGPPPKEVNQDELKELRKKYEEAEQEHVFAFWDELDKAEQASLFDQAKDFDPQHINKLADKALNPPKQEKREDKDEKSEGDEEDKEKKSDKPDLKPLPDSATSSILDSDEADLKKWYDQGLDLIAANKVGVVLMAGGQGTRLGSSAPKGCYDIGLPSKKSLFQLQAERIFKVQELANKRHNKDSVVVPWYVMTSGPTRKPTEDFFKENNHFGLDKENVFIFEQGVLPCISNEGKILLESKSKIAVAPDGNGGIYEALIKNGVVGDMEKRGIKHIHAYCVDNCLVKVADPTFIGFSASKDVSIATKVVRKRNAKESVGLILQKNGKPDVVEYSEIDAETAEEKDGKDSSLLKFRAANIVNHYYSFDFLRSIPEWSHRLPHHVAKKKIPCIDTKSGSLIKPEKPNGIKLEQFVFDCFPFLDMEQFACMEVKREDEFSPLKNAKGTGEDDPDTSRRHIMGQGRRWVMDVGAVVEDDGDEEGVEVSPLMSYAGEGLEFMKGRTIKAPAVIDKPQ